VDWHPPLLDTLKAEVASDLGMDREEMEAMLA
jgi:hypothetical protein